MCCCQLPQYKSERHTDSVRFFTPKAWSFVAGAWRRSPKATDDTPGIPRATLMQSEGLLVGHFMTHTSCLSQTERDALHTSSPQAPETCGDLSQFHLRALSAPQPMRPHLRICAYNLCGPSAPCPILCAHVDLIPSTFRFSPRNPLNRWWASQFQSRPGLCRQSARNRFRCSGCQRTRRGIQSHRSGLLFCRCRQDRASSQSRHRRPGLPTHCREQSQDSVHRRGTSPRQSLFRFDFGQHSRSNSGS